MITLFVFQCAGAFTDEHLVAARCCCEFAEKVRGGEVNPVVSRG